MSTTEGIPYFVLTVLCAVSFILNGTFLIVICKTWTLLQRRRITYHVTSLAISDVLVGASEFCRFIVILSTGKITSRLSLEFRIIQGMAILTSLLAVCLMAIERSLCIKKPLTWNKILSLKRILRIMVGNWVLALPMAILLRFYTLKVTIMFFVLFCIPIFVTAYLYVEISKSNDVHDETQQSSSIGERKKKLIQQKVANLVFILTLVLVITIAPTLLTNVIYESCKLLNCKFIETMKILATYSLILLTLNFIVNPILYGWRISLYRQAFWKMFGRGIYRNEN